MSFSYSNLTGEGDADINNANIYNANITNLIISGTMNLVGDEQITGNLTVTGNITSNGILLSNNIASSTTNADLNISANGTGIVKVNDNLDISGSTKTDTISPHTTNADLNINNNGTGKIIMTGSNQIKLVTTTTPYNIQMGALFNNFDGINTFISTQDLNGYGGTALSTAGGFYCSKSAQIIGNMLLNNASNTTISLPLQIRGLLGGSTTQWMGFRNSSDVLKWHINDGPSGAIFNFAQTGVADFRLAIAPGGFVGINTDPNSNTHIFQVAGGIRATLSSLFDSDLNVTGNLNVDNISSKSTNTNLTLSGNGSGIVSINDNLSVTGTISATSSLSCDSASVTNNVTQKRYYLEMITNTTQAISTGTTTALLFQTTSNSSNPPTYSAGTFTINKAGFYFISYMVIYPSNSTGDREAWIQLSTGGTSNRRARLQLSPVSGTDTALSCSDHIKFAVNDTFQISLFQSSGGTLTLAGTGVNINRVIVDYVHE